MVWRLVRYRAKPQFCLQRSTRRLLTTANEYNPIRALSEVKCPDLHGCHNAMQRMEPSGFCSIPRWQSKPVISSRPHSSLFLADSSSCRNEQDSLTTRAYNKCFYYIKNCTQWASGFESRPGNRLSWRFLYLSSIAPNKNWNIFWKQAMTAKLQIVFNLSLMLSCHSVLYKPLDWQVVTQTKSLNQTVFPTCPRWNRASVAGLPVVFNYYSQGSFVQGTFRIWWRPFRARIPLGLEHPLCPHHSTTERQYTSLNRSLTNCCVYTRY